MLPPAARAAFLERYEAGPALLRRLPESAFGRTGRHTESGVYTDADWFRICAEHLEVHARQIERNRAAWDARG